MRRIARGERILEMFGASIDEAEVESRERVDDPLQVGAARYLDLVAPGVLVNHSCAPNTGLVDDVHLTALRDIAAGEELTYDYSTTIENDTVCLFACECGAPSCRRTISDFSDLSTELQQRYLELGVVQRYIRDGYRRSDSPGFSAHNPAIQRYDARWVAEELRGAATTAPVEIGEQIYRFTLFTEEFCRQLIEECEHQRRWRTAAQGRFESHPYSDGSNTFCDPDQRQFLDTMGALGDVWREVVERHLRARIERLWRTFTIARCTRPYVLRYTPDAIASMGLHHDLETVTLVGYLNDGFEGGGTRFPRWNLDVRGQRPGTAIVYPGGLSHEHEALRVTRGVRYVFCASFF